MKFKYAALNPIAKVGLAGFSGDYEETADFAAADLALVRSAAMHDMELPAGLLAVARAGAGVNNIPLEKCAERGIVVFNTPGANANGVKELAIAGMFLAARDIVGGIEWARASAADPDIAKKAEKQKKQFAGTEIAGKKLGVIGLGAIGVRVANAAAALDMDVCGYDPYISVQAAWNLSQKVRHAVSIEDVCRECDYISIHVPLTDATRGLLNRDCIAAMKPGATVLNFARDLLVDEQAVVEALAAGRLHRYVTDFVNPCTAGKPGVIAIPHLGASTGESEDNCAVMAVKELRDFAENGNISHSVNYPDISLGVCKTAQRVVVLHRNAPGAIGRFTAIFGDAGVNIDNMTNKSRGNYAATLLDLDSKAPEKALAELSAQDYVLKVRTV